MAKTARRRTTWAKDRSDDPDVEIHEAILARERAGAPFPNGDALQAMEEPLHRLTGAAVLFSDITAESSAAPDPRLDTLAAILATYGPRLSVRPGQTRIGRRALG